MTPTRRNMIRLLAATALPAAALAQEPAPPAGLPSPDPAVIPPPPPATISPPTTPAPARPAAPATPSARPPAPPGSAPGPATAGPAPGIDATKAYFVFFEQAIDANTMKALRRQLASLVEAGVQRITLVVHSSGGAIDPMLGTYSFLRALPVRLDTHAIGFVASAATILFLAGERRTADHAARFLYHPSTAPFSGIMNAPQMQDRLNQFAAVNQVEDDIFRDRTTLGGDELRRFTREEVIYTPEQALAGGIIHAIANLRIPGPDKARMLFLD